MLSVEFVDVVAAALTVGRPTWSAVLRYGIYSRAELAYRLFQVVANLVPCASRLARSPAYDGLDPSEKSAISYYCGLTLAKLFADELFAVPYLQHIATYPPTAVEFTGGSRPDLAGLDAAGRWYVVEAKGRSNEAQATLLPKAKEQTTAVGRVAGASPHLRLAVVTDFPRGIIRVQLEDPEEPEEAVGDWNISAAQTLQLHYGPWLAVLDAFEQEQVAIEERRFAVVRLPEVDLAVGLDVRYVRLLRVLLENADNGSVVEELLALVPRAVQHPRSIAPRDFRLTSVRIGTDGILVALGDSWEIDRMAKMR